MPFSFIPALKFQFSIDNPSIKTEAAERIDQTDVGYLVDFMPKNLKRIIWKEDDFYEDGEQGNFFFLAKDYSEEKSSEKYRISLSKKHWLPVCIGRYSLEDRPLEKRGIRKSYHQQPYRR